MVNKNPVSEKAVMDALSKVQEPELHKDLVSLNMIRDVSIDGEEVGFIGEINPMVCETWKLKNPVVGFEVNLERIFF